MNKIINKINYIIGIIEIKKKDIGKEIKILNNEGEYFFEGKENVKKKEKIKIIINGEIKSNIFKYKFKKEGEYKIYYISEELKRMSSMFWGCSELKEINLTSFKTDKVTDMSYMFWGCSGLKEINLTSFKTDKVTNMSYMFSRCSELQKINLKSFKFDSETNMWHMFYECSGLKEINLTSFKTDNVTYMYSMFENVKSCKLKCEDKKILNQFKTDTKCFIF